MEGIVMVQCQRSYSDRALYVAHARISHIVSQRVPTKDALR